MIELRWKISKETNYDSVLQYRETEWTNDGVAVIQGWTDVPSVHLPAKKEIT